MASSPARAQPDAQHLNGPPNSVRDGGKAALNTVQPEVLSERERGVVSGDKHSTVDEM